MMMMRRTVFDETPPDAYRPRCSIRDWRRRVIPRLRPRPLVGFMSIVEPLDVSEEEIDVAWRQK